MPIAVLLAGSVLWGLFWWPLKALAGAGVAGSFVQLVAYALPALVLAPWAWASRAAWQNRLGLLALIALLGGWANASFASALTHGNVVRVMLLFYLAPVWTILAARMVLAEPITQLRLASLALAMAGLAFTLGGPQLFAAPLGAIDLLALSSGLAFALTNIAIRAAHDPGGGGALPEIVRSVAVFAGCALLSAGFMLVRDEGPPAPAAATLLALAALGLFWVLPGMLATYYGVARLEAGKAAILLLAELVVGVVSAVLIGGEHLGLKEAVGGTLILAAAVLEARSEDAPASQEAPA
ncbi:DMT family transporter [Sulfurisoma sediminicola]|uniref:EamA domain-containing membrane protein RarD n=1 Tax=Sulfurisoma sediminicola TaxID=1381557 RepID=A0A497XD91_9PROT|nr:DMT family transporter [Sulfurisoma sediminicola]RLJ64931.1 EamA domain-containing membrane protein RarD [Sulfurisoma sediminicola]